MRCDSAELYLCSRSCFSSRSFRGSDWVFTCGVTGVHFAWHSVPCTEFLQFVTAELFVLCTEYSTLKDLFVIRIKRQ